MILPPAALLPIRRSALPAVSRHDRQSRPTSRPPCRPMTRRPAVLALGLLAIEAARAAPPRFGRIVVVVIGPLPAIATSATSRNVPIMPQATRRPAHARISQQQTPWRWSCPWSCSGRQRFATLPDTSVGRAPAASDPAQSRRESGATESSAGSPAQIPPRGFSRAVLLRGLGRVRRPLAGRSQSRPIWDRT